MNKNKFLPFARRWHRILAMIFLIPMVVTFVTGIFLVYRKEISFMQPKMTGEPIALSDFASAELISNKLKTLGVDSKNISNIRLYPSKGVVSVRTKNYMDYHLKANSLDFLGEFERTDSFFIKLHEGSYFGDWSRLLIWGPMAVSLFLLWISGGVLGVWYYKKRFS